MAFLGGRAGRVRGSRAGPGSRCRARRCAGTTAPGPAGGPGWRHQPRPASSMSESRKAIVTQLPLHPPGPDTCWPSHERHLQPPAARVLLGGPRPTPRYPRPLGSGCSRGRCRRNALARAAGGPGGRRRRLRWPCSASRGTSCCTARLTRESAWSRSSPGPPPMSARGSR